MVGLPMSCIECPYKIMVTYKKNRKDQKFGRFVTFVSWTWGHYWIIFGYFGSHFDTIRYCFGQLFGLCQKARQTHFPKQDRRVSPIETSLNEWVWIWQSVKICVILVGIQGIYRNSLFIPVENSRVCAFHGAWDELR